MGKSEESSSVKMESVSLPRQELTDIHLYPDWAAIQAFYSHGVPFQQPYFNPVVSDGHGHPHARLWSSPQPLIPLYGLPYPAVYSQGIVYAHPALPLVSNPSSKESLSKSSDKIDQGSTKKLRRLDGIALPVGNDCAQVDTEASAHEVSQSVGTDASSNGSDVKSGAHQSRQRSNSTEPCGKVNVQANILPEYCIEAPVAPKIRRHNPVHIPNGKAVPNPVCANEGLSFEVRVQEERHLKRERRKQANRESARRSRLRKQAEFEGVMERYESMKIENMALKSEINQLIEDSEKVKLENAALMEKLNNAETVKHMTPGRDQTVSNSTRPTSTDELCELNNLCSVQVKEEKGF